MSETVFNKNLFKNQAALITGGATGIGYGIAKMFLEHGCAVLIMSRKMNNIEKALETLKRETKSELVFGASCDVRDPISIEKAFDYFLTKVP